MGLDTTHDCWIGAYSAFSRWRSELARAAGYRMLEPVLGVPDYDLPWEQFELKNYQGEWDSPPGDDPLLYLLVHSDCDGLIHPEQARHIADRLEQLLPLLDDDESAAIGHIRPHMRGKTETFIDGLREAVKAGEDVEFY
jgi:hypothetical protein